MTNRPFQLVILTLAGALAACTTAPPPAQVTRFHLNQPISRGHIKVIPLNPANTNDLETQSHVATVANELTRLGFAIDPKLTDAEQIATVDVQRNVQPSALPPRSRFSIGIGGGSYGGGVGLGVGTSFGVGKKQSNDVTLTTLAVQIKRTSDGSTVWEGRAIGKSNDKISSSDEVSRLATALFKDFPGPSGKTVEVK